MIRRIVLENFMSHRHTVIEPADGLTLLEGPNNCGKSAVVVALQTLVENDNQAAKFIRHQAKNARVFAATDEGHQIEWCRPANGSAYYVLNGRRIDRLGHGVPEDLHALLRLPLVKDDRDEEYDVHFADQKSPIFLLNESGSRAATFFASSSDAGRLIRMQALHREKVSDHRKEERRLQEEILAAKGKLGRFDGLATIEAKVARARTAYVGLRASIERASRLASAICSSEDAAFRHEVLDRTLAKLRPLSSPPIQQDTSPLQKHLAERCRQASEAAHWLGVESPLRNLSSPPVVGDSAALASLAARIEGAARSASRQACAAATLHGLAQPPETTDASPIAKIVDRLDVGAKAVARLQARTGTLAPLVAPEGPADTSPLRRALADLETQTSRARSLQEELDAVTEEVEAFRTVIERYVADHPYCPTCGGNLDASRIADSLEAHAHE